MSFPEPPPPQQPEPPDSAATAPLFGPTEALDSHAPAAGTGGRRGAVTAGLAALGLVAAGLTGAVLARSADGDDQAALAASSSSPSASPSADGDEKRGDRRVLRGGPGPMGLAGALHGELIVPDGDGGYQTLVVQRGTASKVGDDTITVTSEDGYVATYDVPADTGVGALREGLGSIESGADVMVTAEKREGSTLTATHVVDLDSIERGFGGFGRLGHGFHGPGDRDGAPPAPVPAPSGSAEGSSSGV